MQPRPSSETSRPLPPNVRLRIAPHKVPAVKVIDKRSESPKCRETLSDNSPPCPPRRASRRNHDPVDTLRDATGTSLYRRLRGFLRGASLPPVHGSDGIHQ